MVHIYAWDQKFFPLAQPLEHDMLLVSKKLTYQRTSHETMKAKMSTWSWKREFQGQ
uniref:cAMP-binding protein n=1 Tax=Ascaris lumbricoides TaxID=6252 RepID=A0A0M3HHG7_ASCLU